MRLRQAPPFYYRLQFLCWNCDLSDGLFSNDRLLVIWQLFFRLEIRLKKSISDRYPESCNKLRSNPRANVPAIVFSFLSALADVHYPNDTMVEMPLQSVVDLSCWLKCTSDVFGLTYLPIPKKHTALCGIFLLWQHILFANIAHRIYKNLQTRTTVFQYILLIIPVL